MNRAITQLCVFVGAASILSGCAAPGPTAFRPTKSEFDSQWVEITAGTVIGERGGQPALMLTLNNKADRGVWVKVGFTSPDPSQSCATVKELTPKGSATYTCPQKDIIADVPYPISVATFSDQALTQHLETKQTKMHFRAQDIAAVKAWMTPPKLPATFSDVWYRTDEAQILIAYKEKGTLVVFNDKLQFTHGKGSIEIPVSSIKKVTPQKTLAPDIMNKWVVVEYRVSEKDGIIAFKYAPFSGKPSDEEIYSAISWAREKK
jgi:hypothetical protein